jgi:hypothetical protein
VHPINRHSEFSLQELPTDEVDDVSTRFGARAARTDPAHSNVDGIHRPISPSRIRPVALADHLADGAKTAGQLAAITNTHAAHPR